MVLPSTTIRAPRGFALVPRGATFCVQGVRCLREDRPGVGTQPPPKKLSETTLYCQEIPKIGAGLVYARDHNACTTRKGSVTFGCCTGRVVIINDRSVAIQ